MTAPPPDPGPWLPPGFVARYELGPRLGEGSSSLVHEARHRDLDRPVVVKLFFMGGDLDAEDRARIEREAQLLAKLDHPRVVALLDHGIEGDLVYLAYPSEGARALHVVREEPAWGDPPRVLRLVREVLEGLGYLHERGVVHRDLKPGNILVLPDGDAQLIDFGLSRDLGGTALTRTGAYVGTPLYSAPDQALRAEPDPRDDLYSLGVIAYELLAGENPFEAGSLPAVLDRHLNHVPPALDAEEVGAPLAHLVAQLLAKGRDDRPPSAAAARALLEGTSPTPARRETRPLAPPPPRAATPPAASPPSPSLPAATARRFDPPAFVLGACVAGLLLLASRPAAPVAPPATAPAPPPGPTEATEHPPPFPSGATEDLAAQLRDATRWRRSPEGWMLRRDGPGPTFDGADPIHRPAALRSLAALRAIHAWLARGGRPEELPPATRAALQELDGVFEDRGLGRPLAPFLGVRPFDEARPVAPELRELVARLELPTPLPARVGGFSGAALAELADLGPYIEAREATYAAGSDHPDAPPFLRVGTYRILRDLLVAARDAELELRDLPEEFFSHPELRAGHADWLGEGAERLGRLLYATGRALDAAEPSATTIAALIGRRMRRLRAVVFGAPAFLGPELLAGGTLRGVAGASLAARVIEASTRVWNGAGLGDVTGELRARLARILVTPPRDDVERRLLREALAWQEHLEGKG